MTLEEHAMLSLLRHLQMLGLFGSGREEDKVGPTPQFLQLKIVMLLTYLSLGTQGSCIVLQMVGYLSFLKVGPKLLKFLPGNKARDLRNWLQIYGVHPLAASSRPCSLMLQHTVYGSNTLAWHCLAQRLLAPHAAYWNEGGIDNVVTMLLYLVDAYMKPTGIEAAAVQVTPPTGVNPCTCWLKRSRAEQAAACWSYMVARSRPSVTSLVAALCSQAASTQITLASLTRRRSI